MTVPLSAIGISKEDQILMSDRLFPEANRIFIERTAKETGYDPKQIQKLDYCDHPLYRQQMMMEKRQMKAKFLKDNKIDTSEFDYPWKTIEEAQANDKESTHILLTDDKYKNIKKKIDKFKSKYDLDNISEEDEKSPHIV